MSTQKIETVYFNDGFAKLKDYLYIAGKLHSLDPEEVDLSRMFIFNRGQWLHHDLEWNVISVCYFEPEEAACALSVEGDINLGTKRGFRAEKIPEAGSRHGLGPVTQIRQIGRRLYVCGHQGQVYRREDRGWVHLDDGLLSRDFVNPNLSFKELMERRFSDRANLLTSIDGSSEEDLYVVGYRGKIFHSDGKGWTKIDSPTHAHLERVRCVSPDEFYLCGDNGLFLRGSRKGFEDFSVPDLKDNFWAVEKFLDKVYLATLKGLWVFDGSSVQPLSTGLDPEVGSFRLDARDGVLWSFGVDDLAWFDGQTWQRLLHPDNP
jgi:hypothetical protein